MRILLISVFVGVFAAFGTEWKPGSFRIVRADGCSDIGTERQQALADGWRVLAHDTNLPQGISTIGGKTYYSNVITAMSEEERKLLADRWVSDNDGTAELAAYWDELAECEGTPSLATGSTDQSDQGRDAACQTLAESWLSEWSGANISVADVEVVTNCRRDADGQWFAPDGPSDGRLTSPILAAEEIEITTALRDTILRQIDAFEERLDTVVGDRAGRSVKTVIYQGYDPELMATDEDMARSNVTYYIELLDAFLTDPTNTALDRYVTWLVDSHEAVAERRCVGINPYACRALRSSVVPARWPWALRDDVTLAIHLKWALDNGYVTRPIETPAARDTNDTDCGALAYWLGETNSRLQEAEASTMPFPFGPTPSGDLVPELERWADELDRHIAIQEMSDPPAEGLALNALLVSWWRHQADAYRTLADAGRAGDQADWDRGVTLSEEADRYAAEAKRVMAEFKASCGLG